MAFIARTNKAAKTLFHTCLFIDKDWNNNCSKLCAKKAKHAMQHTAAELHPIGPTLTIILYAGNN